MTPKDPNTAFVIELVGGFFGLLGLGHMYVGRTNDGVIRLVLWLLYNFIAWFTIVILSVVLIGLCLIPLQLAVQIGVPIWSAATLKKQMMSLSYTVPHTAPQQLTEQPRTPYDYPNEQSVQHPTDRR